MNQRRHFLRMLGGAAAACGAGCSGGTGGAGGAGGVSSAGSWSSGAGATQTTMSSTSSTSSGDCGGGGASNAGKNTDGCHTNAGVFDVGTPADYASTGLHAVTNDTANVLVGRDAGGLYAMSSLCTHQCCDLDNTTDAKISTTSVHCLCHGSTFDDLGNVVAGPATEPLAHHPLALGCDGTLYVDTTKVVASTTRLASA